MESPTVLKFSLKTVIKYIWYWIWKMNNERYWMNSTAGLNPHYSYIRGNGRTGFPWLLHTSVSAQGNQLVSNMMVVRLLTGLKSISFRHQDNRGEEFSVRLASIHLANLKRKHSGANTSVLSPPSPQILLSIARTCYFLAVTFSALFQSSRTPAHSAVLLFLFEVDLSPFRTEPSGYFI